MARIYEEWVDSEKVEFNGKTYRRYINHPDKNARRYFRRGHSSLHRDVWEFYNGSIPKGMQIHHKDGNPVNNDISNLELIDPKSHSKIHEADRSKAAADWHGSEEGREWHRKHVSESLAKAWEQPHYYTKVEATERTCVWCGDKFFAKHPKAKFCQPDCQWKESAYRRGCYGEVTGYYLINLQSTSREQS